MEYEYMNYIFTLAAIVGPNHQNGEDQNEKRLNEHHDFI